MTVAWALTVAGPLAAFVFGYVFNVTDQFLQRGVNSAAFFLWLAGAFIGFLSMLP